MAFKTEKALVKKVLASHYIKKLTDSENKRFAEKEVHGLFGIPDFVVTYSDPSAPWTRRFITVAFEMKLTKWQQALAQAYCYQAFSNKTYVLIDHAHVNPPRKNLTRFREANVGLLSINDEGEVFIHHEPKHRKPYSTRLEDILIKMVFRTKKGGPQLRFFNGQIQEDPAIR